MFIELQIKCYNDSNEAEAMREMGIDTPPKYNYRRLKLRIDHIVGYYPDKISGSFVFLINGDEITVKENTLTIDKLIRDAD